jgi:hypothetical protein
MRGEDKCLLLSISQQSDLPDTVHKYLIYGLQEKVNEARKCRDRRTWFMVPNTFIPPAFFPCMSAGWPRVIVNQSKYTCTNNILRLVWKDERNTDDWFKLALGTLSTLSQLSAELVGRSYGGGVLKLEPKELTNLVVPLVPDIKIKELMANVDLLLINRKVAEATKIIDSRLIETGVMTVDDIKHVQSARNLLFLRRRQHRKDVKRHLIEKSP